MVDLLPFALVLDGLVLEELGLHVGVVELRVPRRNLLPADGELVDVGEVRIVLAGAGEGDDDGGDAGDESGLGEVRFDELLEDSYKLFGGSRS